MLNIVDVKFQEWGKAYLFDAHDMELKDRDKVVVETEEGINVATVRKRLIDMDRVIR